MLSLVMLNIFTFFLFFFILFTCNLFFSRVKKIADRDQMASFSSGYTVFSKQDSRTKVFGGGFFKKNPTLTSLTQCTRYQCFAFLIISSMSVLNL